MVQGSRQWHGKLPFALLGYRTTIRTSTGVTPYLLVYGTEAVIPAEVKIPSLRIISEAEIDDTEWVKSRLEQLLLIDEKRLTAVCFGQLYQKRMARAYNKKVSHQMQNKEKRAKLTMAPSEIEQRLLGVHRFVKDRESVKISVTSEAFENEEQNRTETNRDTTEFERQRFKLANQLVEST
ncbi:uncharacterized protein LOC124891646, partial [Capsicum annuum]|uniref:uncharacterized protein LOC124891646 n=1 Tax=Capsicum annuum TaxID=4072 RepID=UPI001FB1577A